MPQAVGTRDNAMRMRCECGANAVRGTLAYEHAIGTQPLLRLPTMCKREPLIPASVGSEVSPRDATESSLDVSAIARGLGVSVDAVRLCHQCELVDLHLDPLIAHRLWGYDFVARHKRGPFGRWLFGHMDVPRARDGGLSGAMFSITTNPLRTPQDRWATLQTNIERMRRIVSGSDGALMLARSMTEYRRARSAGAVACMPAVQGANALVGGAEEIESVCSEWLVRVTLVHLTSSEYGCTSSPVSALQADRGLTRLGCELVEQLNRARCLVDLAHIHENGFWQALRVHDPSMPVIVTHTGVRGVTDHWRNLDDAQIRAVANTGGTIGILFHCAFIDTLTSAYLTRRTTVDHVIAHMQHVINVVGEDHVSIGSDFDGFIVPPVDLPDVCAYPRLVQRMLERGWTSRRIEKILGGNFLRVFERMRP